MEVALVTTPGGKRWVVPKGSLDEGEDAMDAAIRETEEESGLLGDLEPDPLGRYRFTRNNDRYDVDVFLMQVTVVLDYWSEARLRRRRWLTVEEAALVIRADLRPFVIKAERLVRERQSRARGGGHRERKTGVRTGARMR